MRGFVKVVAAVAWLILAPSLAYGQAAIAGVVKDASGAVLPGVTVEASSPALIERVRSVTTDGSGQYRIIDLRPGAVQRDVCADRLQHGAPRRASK